MVPACSSVSVSSASLVLANASAVVSKVDRVSDSVASVSAKSTVLWPNSVVVADRLSWVVSNAVDRLCLSCSAPCSVRPRYISPPAMIPRTASTAIMPIFASYVSPCSVDGINRRRRHHVALAHHVVIPPDIPSSRFPCPAVRGRLADGNRNCDSPCPLDRLKHIFYSISTNPLGTACPGPPFGDPQAPMLLLFRINLLGESPLMARTTTKLNTTVFPLLPTPKRLQTPMPQCGIAGQLRPHATDASKVWHGSPSQIQNPCHTVRVSGQLAQMSQMSHFSATEKRF